VCATLTLLLGEVRLDELNHRGLLLSTLALALALGRLGVNESASLLDADLEISRRPRILDTFYGNLTSRELIL